MNRKNYTSIEFEKIEFDFRETLSFIIAICDVPFAFISVLDSKNKLTTVDIGFDFLTIPEEILYYNQNVIAQKEVILITDLKKDAKHQSKKSDPSKLDFNFFAGFPIVNDENEIIGSICILDLESKKLSNDQLKIIEYSGKQISAKLKALQQNTVLLNTIKEKETHFELFIDHSKEIVYELDFEGKFTFISTNVTDFLGFKVDEAVGKNIAVFIHPEDIEMCLNHFKNTVETGKSKMELIYRIRHKDGHYVWHSSNLKFQKKNGESVIIGNCRDVTKHIEIQREILQQKEFYEKILDQIPTDVAVFDQNHRYLYLNHAAIKDEKLRKFIVGKDDFEYATHRGRDDSSAKQRRAKFLEAKESKKLIQWEEDVTNPRTRLTSYHDRKLNPVYDENGAFEMMIGFGVDITGSKKTQEEILKSKQLLSSILENIAVGILLQGPQSEILEINEAACDMLGFAKAQLIGRKSFDRLWKVIHLDGSDFQTEDQPVHKAISSLKPVKNIVMGVYRHASMNMVWLLVDAIPVFNDLGKLLYVVCSFNDISELKKIEDELKTSNERFSYSSQATSDAIWDWNMTTNEITIGPSYSEIFGHYVKNNIFLNSEWENFVHPEDKDRCFTSLENAIENKTTTKWSDEYRYLKADGSFAHVNDKALIIRDDSGKAIRMIGAIQDITNKKKLEDELRHSEEQFKEAFEHSPAGMALIDLKGAYIEVNEKLCQILGYSYQEMKSLTFQEITYRDDLEEDLKNKRNLDSGKIHKFDSEKRFVKKDKSLLWTQMSVSLVKKSNTENYYIAQIIDINERKKIELQNKLLLEENNKNRIIQLNEAKNRYRFLAENSVDIICLHNLDGTFQYISPSVVNILGHAPTIIKGKSALDFVHPDDLQYVKDSFIDFIDEKTDDRTIARFLTSKGTYIWLETRANIIKEKGVKTAFQSSSRDITTRKEEEEIIKKTLAKERELNELRSNLVSTVSHEFRTPMTTIRTSAELISIYLEGHNFDKKQRLEKQLSTITGEIDRIVELMNSVLTISRNDAGKTNFNPITFDLRQLCFDVIETSFDNQTDGRQVQKNIKDDNFLVFADKNLMEYTIFNILNNAFKYSQDSGDVVLKLFVSASNINLQIIDKGIGIPQEDQPKLFNTFFRASNSNGIPGTGLGLYIVKTFTEKNSGTIKLESRLGKGTTITLQFPLQKP